MKILMVCLGNICRSPLADGLLRRKVREQNLDVVVDSAGTSGFHAGEAPDSRMIETAAKRGTDLSFLRARPFTSSDFKQFDLIYVMDKNNLRDISGMASNDAEIQKIRMILHEVNPTSELEVPDPYYGTWKDFESVYDILDEATDTIILKIKNNQL